MPLPRRETWVTSESTKGTRKMKNSNFVRPVAATATPVKLKTPAIRAIAVSALEGKVKD
jgi:hypothetical protein